MPRVLFLCTGNTCRSPLAEVFARQAMTAQLGIGNSWIFESTGLQARQGLPASPESIEVARLAGLDLVGHRSRQLSAEMLAQADFIIGMTRSHAAIFQSRHRSQHSALVGILGAVGVDLSQRSSSPECEEVDDPFGRSLDDYHVSGRQIRRLIQQWIPFWTDPQQEGPAAMAQLGIVSIGSDHRGIQHKSLISEFLQQQGYEVRDFGCHGPESADYSDAALPVAEMVGKGEAVAGILICGSGIGMSIAANKVLGVRASLVFTENQARTTRQHNDSNVLCLSGDGVDADTAVQLTKAWLSSSFEGGRHSRRVDKIIAWEQDHQKQE